MYKPGAPNDLRNFVLISPCNTTLNLTIYRIICDIIDK